MARPRAFDEQQVLRSAMRVFWQSGYEATSIDELASSTGLSRSSIYSAYGSKHGLFEAVLACYVDGVIGPMLDPVSLPGAGIDGVTGFFDRLLEVSQADPVGAGLGCLMTNTIAEVGSTDPELRSVGDAYLSRLRGAFRAGLVEAERLGQIEAGHAESRAEILAAIVLGAFVTARGAPSPEASESIARSARALVESWQVAA